MTDGQILLLADIILILHFFIALFLTLGLPAIWLGYFLNWNFARNPWFRYTHAGLMGFVTLESLAGMLCPLTTWEASLRRFVGMEGSNHQQSFIAHWVGELLFHDFDELFFTFAYAVFFLAIIVTFFLIPVERQRKKQEKKS